MAVYGQETLSLQVDKEINLLQGLTIAEGLIMQKVEIVQDGVRTVIDDPKAYTPEYPGSIDFVLTLARPDGTTIDISIENLLIDPLEYDAIIPQAALINKNWDEWKKNVVGDRNWHVFFETV